MSECRLNIYFFDFNKIGENVSSNYTIDKIGPGIPDPNASILHTA